jgi:AcrR family transcriptional regulator
MGMHKTKRALIDTVITLMDGNPSADITIQQVLTTSGITSGSLYYHFSDFQELIDYALADLYGQFADDIRLRLIYIIGSSNTAKETFEKLSPAIDDRHIPDFSAVRSARAWIAAQATLRPSLGEKLREEQARVTQEIAELIADAQARGIAQEGLDPYVVAVFIEAYTMGRIVDDLAGSPMNEFHWAEFIKHMVTKSLLKFDN